MGFLIRRHINNTFLNGPRRHSARFIGMFVALSVIALYNLLFFNRYFPLSEGWFSTYADYMLRGAIPYRDFQLALPPVYSFFIAGFIFIFGKNFIALRILGIMLILSMTVVLYLLYARLFPVYIACMVSIVSIMYYQSGVAHIAYDFLQFVTFFALLSAYLICKYGEADSISFDTKSGRNAGLFLMFSGIISALAFLTKQSNGFFVVLSSFFAVVVIAYRKNIGFLFKSVAIFILGLSLPISIIAVWLSVEGALNEFLQQVIFGASQAKGTLRPILFGWIPRLLTKPDITAFVTVSITILAVRYSNFLIGRLGDWEKREFKFPFIKDIALLWMILILSMVCIYVPYANMSLSKDIPGMQYFNWLYDALIITSTMTSIIFFCIYFYKLLVERKKYYADIFIISTISLGLLYGTATSAQIAEAGAFLSCGLMFGYLFFIRSPYNIGKSLCLGVCLMLMLLLASRKYNEPYRWWGLAQPDIRTATERAEIKYLDGFYLSEDTVKVISEVKNIIEKNTMPGESIFTFPNIPLFYLLTDRYPDTFAIVHWFDVAPDKVAIEDAHRILMSPPKIIVLLDVPEFVWTGHEEGFRGGLPSGQREIVNTIRNMTSNPSRYVLEAEFRIPHDYTLKVWRRLEKIGGGDDIKMVEAIVPEGKLKKERL